MSTDALNLAKHRRTGSTGRKATLMIAADICDEYGVMYGGVDYLAGILECHRDTVINHLQKLEEDGHLCRIRRTKQNGAPTSSLLVLAPRDEDRGTLRDPRDHPEHGKLIRTYLARPVGPKSESSEPKSGNPKSGSSDTQVGIFPGLSRDSRHNTSTDTSTRDTSASGGERARASSIALHLDHLQPLVDARLIDAPQIDGSDVALLTAVQQHGDELVTAALDRVVSWASGTGDQALSTRSLRRLLPAALEHARRGGDTRPGHGARQNGRKAPQAGSGRREDWPVVHPSGVRRHPHGYLVAVGDEQERARQQMLAEEAERNGIFDGFAEAARPDAEAWA